MSEQVQELVDRAIVREVSDNGGEPVPKGYQSVGVMEIPCIAVTLGQLINSTQSIGALISQPMPIRTSFQLGKLVRAINLELEQYQSSRKELCERHAEKDSEGKAKMLDDGQRYDIKKMEEFDREHQELTAVEVTIPGSRIKVSDLGTVSIAPAHLLNLEWLLVE